MIESAYVLTVVLLTAAVMVQEVLHHKERSELIDRIMSRNLSEYKAYNADTNASADESEGKPGERRLHRHREVIMRWRSGGDG